MTDYDDEIPRLDPELLTLGSIQWITQTRIVGLNRESVTGKYCFISGEGTCDDGGVFFARNRSSDPVFPHDDQLAVAPGRVPEFRIVYENKYWPEDGNFFPFHSACFEVLKNLASGRLSDRDNDRDEVDATLLFSYFRYLYSPECDYYCPSPGDLELPYVDVDMGYLGMPQEQFWEFRRGEEVYVSNPFEIPKLGEYYKNLPHLPERKQEGPLGVKRKIDGCADDDFPQRSQHEQEGSKRHKGDLIRHDSTNSPSSNTASCDPLERLLPEILIEVFIYLPALSIVNVKIASPTARNTQLSNWFWWKRMQSAFPCLWDLPSFHGSTGSENIDWYQVYKDLSSQGLGHGQGKILGLVNRHRIWQEWEMKSWFEGKASCAEQEVTDAMLKFGDRQTFREWRAERGQTMSGDSLPLSSYQPISSA